MSQGVIIGFSGLLVVAVAIGVIVGVSNSGKSSDDAALSTTSKSVASVCSQTTYKQQCVASLSTVANNQTATPLDFLSAAIDYTIKQYQVTQTTNTDIAKGVTDDYHKMAVEDCQDLMQSAVADLQASFSVVGDSDLHTIQDRQFELNNWISAVVSYPEACLDDINNPELKTALSNGMLNATQLTANALSIVSSITQILTSFNIPVANPQPAASRRLLQANGYPTWLSSADRKLLVARAPNVRPNAIVAKDGSGRFKTISAAVASCPMKSSTRCVIYVKAGVYDEYITIQRQYSNIFMYGDGPRRTIVTGKKCNTGGVPTFKSASFAVMGDGFIAKSMGFSNTAGAIGHQAVALRVQSQNSVFYNCRMDGYQDTLYAQSKAQFYRNSVISGTVDFIFGDSPNLIQNCLIIVRKPMDNQQNTVTAQGRTNPQQNTGIVIQNCRIVPEQLLESARFKIPTFLGRPWKQYARTVVMQSTLADFIQPAGWMPWAGNFALNTLYYGEYQNRGPGATTAKRVNWKGYRVITNSQEAMQFTVGPFLQGQTWLPATGVPFFMGLARRK